MTEWADFAGVNLPIDAQELHDYEWAFTLSQRGWIVVRWDERPYLPRVCPGIPRHSCMTMIVAPARYCSFCRGTRRFRRREPDRISQAKHRRAG